MKTKTKTKVALVALCLLASHGAMAKDYYLAPNGSGNGMTIDKPFGDPVKAFAALKAGDILYVRGGTYKLSQTINVTETGTADKRICVFAYPGDTERPVFDFAGQPRSTATVAANNRGIMHKIGANYWHYRGLDICNSADNGMKLEEVTAWWNSAASMAMRTQDCSKVSVKTVKATTPAIPSSNTEDSILSSTAMLMITTTHGHTEATLMVSPSNCFLALETSFMVAVPGTTLTTAGTCTTRFSLLWLTTAGA